MILFVYGTLMSTGKFPINDRFQKDAIKIGEYSTKGQLYCVQSAVFPFPALVQKQGTVKGELWDINPEILDDLFRYEGNLYDFKLIDTIRYKGRSRGVFAFVWNQSTDGLEEIESGDWNEFINKTD